LLANKGFYWYNICERDENESRVIPLRPTPNYQPHTFTLCGFFIAQKKVRHTMLLDQLPHFPWFHDLMLVCNFGRTLYGWTRDAWRWWTARHKHQTHERAHMGPFSFPAHRFTMGASE